MCSRDIPQRQLALASILLTALTALCEAREPLVSTDVAHIARCVLHGAHVQHIVQYV